MFEINIILIRYLLSLEYIKNIQIYVHYAFKVGSLLKNIKHVYRIISRFKKLNWLGYKIKSELLNARLMCSIFYQVFLICRKIVWKNIF